ncbi:hypothetical protein THAOC_32113 [Thalassiosira oceanica]|uniref:Uncharacterized protein n=1 Tax=Thalassiosira oceanica TaxID=159749 RepID=K0RQQ5_THAOC|nr:hypothetical protein THAOC_32113 [Thalassiosira oceanica]|eukprot:EJK49047.1 hypothetical protein THAOC_32113 [Thalassiosira oceanica]
MSKVDIADGFYNVAANANGSKQCVWHRPSGQADEQASRCCNWDPPRTAKTRRPTHPLPARGPRSRRPKARGVGDESTVSSSTAADDKWKKDPISRKKLLRGDGALETVKVVLGWLIDTVAGDDRTPHLASSSTAPGDPRRFPAIAPPPDNREGPRRLRGPLSEQCDNLGVPAAAGDAPQSQCPDLCCRDVTAEEGCLR